MLEDQILEGKVTINYPLFIIIINLKFKNTKIKLNNINIVKTFI